MEDKIERLLEDKINKKDEKKKRNQLCEKYL